MYCLEARIRDKDTARELLLGMAIVPGSFDPQIEHIEPYGWIISAKFDTASSMNRVKSIMDRSSLDFEWLS